MNIDKEKERCRELIKESHSCWIGITNQRAINIDRELSMEIEAGEYVRTKKKGIFRILSKRQTPYGYYCGATDSDKHPTYTIGKGGTAEIKNDIVKHSKNIIDLIEVRRLCEWIFSFRSMS